MLVYQKLTNIKNKESIEGKGVLISMTKLSKKWVIILSTILAAIGIALSLFLFVFKNDNENTYIAYVDINPLIKLNFKVSCDKDNNCSNPIVKDYEFINEDAKTIYKDLVIKDKPLKETIELLANTVKDNDIVFKEIHIYSNYNHEEEFKVDSTDYNITFDVKTDNDLEQFIDELVVKKENIITKEIYLPVTHPYKPELMKKYAYIPENGFTIDKKDAIYNIGSQEIEFIGEYGITSIVYLVRGATIDIVCIKVTIQGPKEIVSEIPAGPFNSPADEGAKKQAEYLSLQYDLPDSIGTYPIEITAKSNNPDIEILDSPILKTNLKVDYIENYTVIEKDNEDGTVSIYGIDKDAFKGAESVDVNIIENED